MSEHLIGDKDALAAEYVLGTLDFEERSAAQNLRAQDAEFAAKVRFWERRLGELHLMVEPVEPEPEIWQRISAKLPQVPRPEPVVALPQTEPELEPEPEITEARLAPAESKAEESKAEESKAEESKAEESKTEDSKPAEPTIGESALGEPALGEPNLGEPFPFEAEAAELKPELKPEPKSEPELSAVTDIPSAKAPPATPDAPAVSLGQPVPPQPADVMPSAGPLDVNAVARSAVADALAVQEPPFPPAVLPSPPEVGTDETLRITKRHLAFWRTAALLMAVAVLAGIVLVSLWRYLPDRVPPELRPLELMRLVGITIETSRPARKPAPPESRFDE
jgi:anti-sigma-K factor RskA